MGGNLFKSSSRFPRECLVPTVKEFKKAIGLPDDMIGDIHINNEHLAGSKHKPHLGDIDIVVDFKKFYEWVTGNKIKKDDKTFNDNQIGLLIYDKKFTDEIIEGVKKKINTRSNILNHIEDNLGHKSFKKNFIDFEINVLKKELEMLETDYQKISSSTIDEDIKKRLIQTNQRNSTVLNKKIIELENHNLNDSNDFIFNSSLLTSTGTISFLFPIVIPNDFLIEDHLEILLKKYTDGMKQLESLHDDILIFDETSRDKKQNLINFFSQNNPIIYTQIDIILGNIEWMKKQKSGVPLETIDYSKTYHSPALRFILLSAIFSELPFSRKKKIIENITGHDSSIKDNIILNGFLNLKNENDNLYDNNKENPKYKFRLAIDSAAGLVLSFDTYSISTTGKTKGQYKSTPDKKEKIVITTNVDELIDQIIPGHSWEHVKTFEDFWNLFKSREFGKNFDKKNVVEKFIDNAERYKLLRPWVTENEVFFKTLGMTIPNSLIKENKIIKNSILNELKQIIRNLIQESTIEERKRKKKWIPRDLKKGALSRYFDIPEEEDIPISMINKEIRKLNNKKEREGGLTNPELKLLRRLYFAKTMKKM